MISAADSRAAEQDVRALAEQRLGRLTKPHGALGRLEQAAVQLCAIQRTLRPDAEAASLLIFAADHGLAHEGVSAYPRSVTAQMLGNFVGGGAAASVLARSLHCELVVIDAGVDADATDAVADHEIEGDSLGERVAPRFIRRRIARGTANSLQQPAMTASQRRQALDLGAEMAASAIDRGARVVLLGEMGIGNTASASLLLHGLTGWPLPVCVGRGTGLDDAGLARKLQILQRVALRAGDQHRGRSAELLQQFGGFEIAALCGAAQYCAQMQTPVLVDGFTVSVAIALAAQDNPDLLEGCLFGHVSAEQAHRTLLRHLDVRPLLDLELRLGEGSGALLALPLLRSAALLFRDMATFDEAQVSARLARDPK